MSQEKHLYTGIWKKNAAKFKEFLESEEYITQFQLSKDDFDRASFRGRKSYTFNLEMKDGQSVNNISGSAVARDLRDFLLNDGPIRKLLSDKHVKFNLGKAFILKMQKL